MAIKNAYIHLPKTVKKEDKSLIDQTLIECIDRELFSATDFADMMQYLKRFHPYESREKERSSHTVKFLDQHSHFLYETNTQKRDVNEYIAVLEGQP